MIACIEDNANTDSSRDPVRSLALTKLDLCPTLLDQRSTRDIMFSTSLRNRPEWASLPTILLGLDKPRWQEANITSHDIQIPVPHPKQNQQVECFNFVLLSTNGVKPIASEDIIARVEQLYHRNGGRNVGVIFLLLGNSSHSSATTAFMEMQEKYVQVQHAVTRRPHTGRLSGIDIPILPLATISNLQATVTAFQKQLYLRRSAEAVPTIPKPVLTLLPHCSSNTIPEHARNILSDVCHSIPDLAQASTTQEGKTVIRQWLSDSPEIASDIIGFWEQEFVVD